MLVIFNYNVVNSRIGVNKFGHCTRLQILYLILIVWQNKWPCVGDVVFVVWFSCFCVLSFSCLLFFVLLFVFGQPMKLKQQLSVKDTTWVKINHGPQKVLWKSSTCVKMVSSTPIRTMIVVFMYCYAAFLIFYAEITLFVESPYDPRVSTHSSCVEHQHWR